VVRERLLVKHLRLQMGEERARLPHRLRDKDTGKTGRLRLHRGVLQQPPPILSTRLPPPQRSPLQLPAASPGSIRETTNSAVRKHRSSPLSRSRATSASSPLSTTRSMPSTGPATQT
jgi:hypothetical protein